MKTAILAAAVSILFSAPAFAAENAQTGVNFEQRKSEMLKHLDERIAHIQEEKACVQAAMKPDDVRACRDRFRSEMKEQRQKRR